MDRIKVGKHSIGEGCPAYLIAEMSANHAGSLERAKEIVHAAKESGADCIKIQTYTPDTLTIDCSNRYFQVGNGTWEGENLYKLYGKGYTPWEWQADLKAEAEKVGIDFLSTPFDRTSVDFLEELGLQFYKIASFEMIDLPLVEYVASKGKPVIMSTGMGTLEEIREAVEAVRKTGNGQLALLRCSSAYPADPAQMHLSTIQDMKKRFGLPVGLSDHSLGSMSAVAAVALGAKIVEKHFCISREIENPDASFSMTPQEYKAMVRDIRTVEEAIGEPAYGVSPQEESSMVFRRSIFAVRDIAAGERLTPDNVRIIRPGYGLKPKYYRDIIGMRTDRALERGTPLSFDALEKGAILFVTNNGNTEDLYRWLSEREPKVYRIENKLTPEAVEQMAPSFIISFNYRHMIPEEVLRRMPGRVINLHTSLLPYNRGSSPNFFSFLCDTPKGVTIHLVDRGLDTGDILCQREISFDEEKETFASSYDRLLLEVKELFRENWEKIKRGDVVPRRQEGEGSFHRMRELTAIREQMPFTWFETVANFKRRYREAEAGKGVQA
ncbi:MAG: pseudaminic acid synthase [Lachnospiraceae bacterium]|nr:pseudaminic acid synthase [Lachnospiraceae bacterium]